MGLLTFDLIRTAAVRLVPAAGLVSINDWASAVESVMHLGLPWRMLRSQLATVRTSDGMINYHDWFNEIAISGNNTEVSTQWELLNSKEGSSCLWRLNLFFHHHYCCCCLLHIYCTYFLLWI